MTQSIAKANAVKIGMAVRMRWMSCHEDALEGGWGIRARFSATRSLNGIGGSGLAFIDWERISSTSRSRRERPAGPGEPGVESSLEPSSGSGNAVGELLMALPSSQTGTDFIRPAGEDSYLYGTVRR